MPSDWADHPLVTRPAPVTISYRIPHNQELTTMSQTPVHTIVDHVDVLIIGAGISGIGAAYYLQREHPGRSYAILEARGASGGTWDLFPYPRIRSDSDAE